MSWQDYIDKNLLGSGMVDQAAIYGHDGSVWATSRNFKLDATEVDQLKKGIDDQSVFQANGVRVGGKKYFFLRGEPGISTYAKGMKNDGAIIVKTAQCYLIGTYKEPVQPGQATTVVENLGDWLRQAGY